MHTQERQRKNKNSVRSGIGEMPQNLEIHVTSQIIMHVHVRKCTCTCTLSTLHSLANALSYMYVCKSQHNLPYLKAIIHKATLLLAAKLPHV